MKFDRTEVGILFENLELSYCTYFPRTIEQAVEVTGRRDSSSQSLERAFGDFGDVILFNVHDSPCSEIRRLFEIADEETKFLDVHSSSLDFYREEVRDVLFGDERLFQVPLVTVCALAEEQEEIQSYLEKARKIE